MSTYEAGNLWCPACSGSLAVAKAESGPERAPLHNDLTVCNHCLMFLRYVETYEGLCLEVLEAAQFEALNEKHQAALMTTRAKLLAAAAGAIQRRPPLGAVLAAEIVKLKRRVELLEQGRCDCVYCRGGDGLNCSRRRSCG